MDFNPYELNTQTYTQKYSKKIQMYLGLKRQKIVRMHKTYLTSQFLRLSLARFSREIACLPSRKNLANESFRHCDVRQVLCILTISCRFIPKYACTFRKFSSFQLFQSSELKITGTLPEVTNKNTNKNIAGRHLMKCCVLNAQFLRNKSADFVDYICDFKPDIVAVTETWFKEIDSAAKIEATPAGYKLLDHPRPGRTGGGTAIVLRDTFCMSKSAAKVLNSFEYSEWKITSGPVTVNAFIEEFSQYLETIIMSTDPLLITGDSNIHVNSKSDNDVLKFLDLLQSIGLRQHVEFPTHMSGNTLDLVFTREVDSISGSQPQSDHCFSDHILILFELTTSKPPPSKEYVSYRPIKSVDISKFTADLAASNLCLNTPMQLDSLANCYNNTLSDLLDRHAPLKNRIVTSRTMVPWYNEEIKLAKKERRRAERKWRITKTTADLNVFKSLKNRCTYLMRKAKCSFFSDFVEMNSDNQGKLFRAIKILLKGKDKITFPRHDEVVLVNELGKHFVKKILDIHSEIDNGTSLADNDDGGFQRDDYIEYSVNIPSFEAFEPLSENDVYNLIMNSKKKSSYLDPVPTDLLMKCLDVLLPVITKIINISLDTGCFPNDWKEAIILPILKKARLESSFDNLRPVSNLAYISKLIERAIYNHTGNTIPLKLHYLKY